MTAPTPPTPNRSENPATSADLDDSLLTTVFGFDDTSETWLDCARRAVQPPPPLGQLGDYVLLEEIGRGGQGSVYRAIQPGTDRTVAVKRLGAGIMLSGRDREQFTREVHAITRLAHPNVVTVHAAEIVESHPIIVMEYVDGVAIDRWAEGVSDGQGGIRTPTLEQILTTFAQVCDAVAHAHQRGVIHRDIKPSNILVGADGAPHVLDFGIAKLADDLQNNGTMTIHSSTGFAGTPLYSSPEQLDGRADRIDTRSDVFSLGVLLYRLLAGQEPFVLGGGLTAMLDRINCGPPHRPSQLKASLNRELDWIALKALESDPDQRYQTVDALATDLRHYLSGKPLLAHPPSKWYLTRKFVRRHRSAVAASTFVVLTLVTGVIVSTASYVRAEQARRAEFAARQHAELRRYIADIRTAATALSVGDVGSVRAALVDAPTEHRGWEWHYLMRRSDDSLAVIDSLPGDPVARHLSGFGPWLYVSSPNAHIARLYDVQEDTPRLIGVAGAGAANRAVILLPEQHLLADDAAVISKTETGTFTPVVALPANTSYAGFVNVRGDTQLILYQMPGRFIFVPLNAIELTTASSTDHGSLPTLDIPHNAATLEINNLRHSYSMSHAVGTLIALGSGTAGEVMLIDADTPRVISQGHVHKKGVLSLDFSPDGTLLATASYEKTARILSVPELDVVMELHGHDEVVSTIAFLPCGTRVVTASWDGTIRIWDVRTGQCTRTLRGHDGAIRGMHVREDGAMAYTMGDEGEVRQWSLRDSDGPSRNQVIDNLPRIAGFAITPDSPSSGWCIAAGFWPDQENPKTIAQAVSVTHPDIRHTLIVNDCLLDPWNSCTIRAVDCHPSGSTIAVGGYDGAITFFDVPQELNEPFLLHQPLSSITFFGEETDGRGLARHTARIGSFNPDQLDCVRFSPAGAHLAASIGSNIAVFDTRTGQDVARAVLNPGVLSIAFSPDGDQIAIASTDGTVAFWRWMSDTQPETKIQLNCQHADIDWSRDGQWIVCASYGGATRLWRANDFSRTFELHARDACFSARFNGDGTRIVTAGYDRTIRVWHTESALELLTLHGHELFLAKALFSNDSNWIISAAPDNTVRLWDGRPRSMRP